MSINQHRHEEIESETLSILDVYNIDKPVIDVTKITGDKGIEIKEVEMPEKYSDVAGFCDKEQKNIYINIKDNPARKLFTIAHELGHIFLGHKNYSVLFRIPKKDRDTEYKVEEQEANSFAASLLMPDFMVQEYLEKYNLSKSDFKTMASIFGVPVEAMKIKLDYLK